MVGSLAVSVAGESWTLAWPRELFVSEAKVVLSRRSLADGPQMVFERAHWLLGEAFVDAALAEGFAEAWRRDPPKGSLSPMQNPLRALSPKAYPEWLYPGPLQRVAELVEHSASATERPAWRPYHHDEKMLDIVSTPWVMARREVAELIDEVAHRGYLPSLVPVSCDTSSDTPGSADAVKELLATHADLFGVWPPLETFRDWAEQPFYGFVEFLYDQVRRPRRAWHCGRCESLHFAEHVMAPGRRLYAWRINRIFAAYGVPLRLAEVGDDAGRLVATSDPVLGELAESLAGREDVPMPARVRHAVKLYRARGAAREDKRSAAETLYTIVEEHRALVKAELLPREEGAFFELANRFDIRHRQGDQISGYDEAFLDWYFWLALATVDLISHLLQRQGTPP